MLYYNLSLEQDKKIACGLMLLEDNEAFTMATWLKYGFKDIILSVA